MTLRVECISFDESLLSQNHLQILNLSFKGPVIVLFHGSDITTLTSWVSLAKTVFEEETNYTFLIHFI